MFKNIDLNLLKSLDWEQILLPHIYSLEKIKTREGLKSRHRAYYRHFIFQEDCKIILPAESDILFFRSLSPQRLDYTDLYLSVLDSTPPEVSCANFSFFEAPSDKPNIARMRSTSYLHNLASFISNYKPQYRLSLAYAAIHAVYILDRVLDYHFKVFVSFSEMQTIDNCIIQYLNVRGIKTVSMQHGLYVEYTQAETVNRINYLSSPSKNLLLWGRSTAHLFLKFHKLKNLYLCGKIKLSIDQGASIEQRFGNEESILVIMDQELYVEENYKMIEVALSLAADKTYQVFARFHPQNIKQKYFKAYPTLRESGTLLPHKFIIGHTSTLLFEAAALGKQVAQFDSEADRVVLNSNLLFSTKKTLEDIISNYSPPHISDHFVALGDMSSARYKSALVHILNKTDKVFN